MNVKIEEPTTESCSSCVYCRNVAGIPNCCLNPKPIEVYSTGGWCGHYMVDTSAIDDDIN